MATKKLHFETLQLHVGQEQPDSATDARAVPIYQTTSYVFHNAQHAADRFGLRDTGNIYGRLTNSTQGVFEARVAALEGGVAGLAVASGAAAVTYALQNIVRAGDHIIAADNLYGGSFNLITHTLASQGITNTIINVNDLNALEAAIRENTKAIYVETFGNPNSDVTNLDAVAEVAHRQHIPLIVQQRIEPILYHLFVRRENGRSLARFFYIFCVLCIVHGFTPPIFILYSHKYIQIFGRKP